MMGGNGEVTSYHIPEWGTAYSRNARQSQPQCISADVSTVTLLAENSAGLGSYDSGSEIVIPGDDGSKSTTVFLFTPASWAGSHYALCFSLSMCCDVFGYVQFIIT